MLSIQWSTFNEKHTMPKFVNLGLSNIQTYNSTHHTLPPVSVSYYCTLSGTAESCVKCTSRIEVGEMYSMGSSIMAIIAFLEV